jgi:HNH endonuclease
VIITTYLPDGREVMITQAPGPVFKAVLAGVFGYGASADAAVEHLLTLEWRGALDRALARGWPACARYRAAPDHYPVRGTIHHADGNPYNNDPGNLQLIDVRENFRAVNINASRLENGYSELP